jgi:hypothetical protein
MWLLACSPTPDAVATGPGPSGDPDADVDADADTDADADADADAVPEFIDIEVPWEGPVRFVALGDAGTGSLKQYDVADAMKAVCDESGGCQFALYLGDNFYNDGVEAVDDAQFEEKFELPYAELDFPFYPVMGNHDYGAGGSGTEFWKSAYEVEYSDHSEKWSMPDSYYRVRWGEVEVYALDTQAMLWGFYEAEAAMVAWGLANTNATWSLATGHHPYLSNGHHGNAGTYDSDTFSPIWSGENVRTFVDSYLCGSLDMYLCGHDHSLQWPESTCEGTEFVVSGGGSGNTMLDGTNAAWYEAESAGFFLGEIDGSTLTGGFYDSEGSLLYERTVSK